VKEIIADPHALMTLTLRGTGTVEKRRAKRRR
jgi:hypothetical protein